ncbi:uncharacterized protein EAF01_002039 [Botrytis porri]|nr:uncharacterized protein EAF01_002039 [Botrytis porri]KAF7913018.1 hypothetical protein EAF01_002039 [Botrytis porri]
MIPKSVLEGAMLTVRESSAAQRQFTDEPLEDIRDYYENFHSSLNFPSEDSQIIELPDICPKLFCHIVQYMNTTSIDTPTSDNKRSECPNLPTLTYIWFLAHYLLIPRVQDIAILRIFGLLDHVESEPVFEVDEMVTALNIACGTDGIMVADDNNVYSLLGSYMIWHSDYRHWTDEQKDKVPRKVLYWLIRISELPELFVDRSGRRKPEV